MNEYDEFGKMSAPKSAPEVARPVPSKLKLFALTIPIIIGLLVLLLVVVVSLICFYFWLRTETKIVPASAAYADRFEVVVYSTETNGKRCQVTSAKLAEAETEVRTNPSATFLIPDAEVADVERQLEAAAKSEGGNPYPFVRVSAKSLDDRRQIVQLSWHYSMYTYSYKYEATDKSVRPIESSFRSLSRNTRTEYSEGERNR